MIPSSGAVAQDGRVEPGDMILEVNGISFENMSNDDAVRTLREAVQKPGWVKDFSEHENMFWYLFNFELQIRST